MGRVMRKPAFCICVNKDADQLRGNREANQRLSFRYTDSTIPLLSKSEISSLYPSSVAVQPGLCRTWTETPKTGFLRTRLILFCLFVSYYHKLLINLVSSISTRKKICLIKGTPSRESLSLGFLTRYDSNEHVQLHYC